MRPPPALLLGGARNGLYPYGGGGEVEHLPASGEHGRAAGRETCGGTALAAEGSYDRPFLLWERNSCGLRSMNF